MSMSGKSTCVVIVEHVHEPRLNTSGRGYVLLKYLFISFPSTVSLSSPPYDSRISVRSRRGAKASKINESC